MSMIPWVVMAASSVAVDYVNPIPGPGEEGFNPAPRHHLRFVMENDSAFGSDCNYTHGTRIDYARVLDKNPNHALGVSFTQNIYTPETHTDGAVPGEHPYAGYAALGLAHMYIGEQVGNCIEFQIGTTGKASLADEMQDFIHKTGGLDRWEGWQDQVPSEVTFQLTARQDYRLPWLEWKHSGGLQTDATFFTREELGTAFIAAEAGAYVRLGKNLANSMQMSGNHGADYGVGLLHKPDYDPTELSWYVRAGGSVKYVVHDFSIDGGVFHDFERTCGRMPWVSEAQLGVGVRRNGVDYYAGMVVRSRNYRTQKDDTVFGTFNFAFHW